MLTYGNGQLCKNTLTLSPPFLVSVNSIFNDFYETLMAGRRRGRLRGEVITRSHVLRDSCERIPRIRIMPPTTPKDKYTHRRTESREPQLMTK